MAIEAFDKYGNVVRETRTIIADKQAPSVSLSVSPYTGYVYNTFTVTATYSDNVALESVVTTIDGQEIKLDENNQYQFVPTEARTYVIKCVATDTAGYVTERVCYLIVKADMNKPNCLISASNDVVLGNSIKLTGYVHDSENGLKSYNMTVNGQAVELADTDRVGYKESVFTPSELGEYKVVLTAEDKAGNISIAEKVITCVADTNRPTASVKLSNAEVVVGDSITVTVETKDNVAVTEIIFYQDDVEVPLSDALTHIYTADAEGLDANGVKYVTFKVVVRDAAGNETTANVKLKVIKEDTVKPTATIYCPANISLYSNYSMTITAKDNIAVQDVVLTVNGQEVTLDANGRYYFDTSDFYVYDIKLVVTDTAGNVTEVTKIATVKDTTTPTVSITRKPSSPKMGDTVVYTVTVSDNHQLADVTVSFDGQIIEGVDFSTGAFIITVENISAGTHKLEVVATDYSGNVRTASNQCTVKDTEAPTVVLSSQKDKYAVDAYAYVVNNIRYDCYVNSRRGGIGAFETTWGNDYDQSSLLIAFLREMGYPARYVSGNITLTEKQLNALLGTTDYLSACQHFANSGRKVTMNSSQKVLKLDQVWVEVYVPYSMIGVTDDTTKDLGVWVSLDPAIKTSELVSYAVDQESIADSKAEYDAILSQFTSDDVSALVDAMKDTKMSDTVKERLIIQQSFTVLPSVLQYAVNSRGNAFAHVTTAMSDTIRFSMSDWFEDYDLGTYRTAELYNKRVSIQYTGNAGSATIFELGASAVAYNEFTPALTIDGKIVATGPTTTLGCKQVLNVTMTSGGGAESFTDELQAGSMYAIVLNTGVIAQQTYDRMFNEALEGNGVIDRENAATKTDYYREEQVCSFLALAGNFYFILDNGLSAMNAGRYNVEESCRTKCAVVGYDIEVEENLYGVYTKVLPGSFFIDVNLNSTYSVNREGDQDARNAHVFSSSIIGSVLEGFIWEYYLGHHGISTMHIFSYAVEQGVNLLPIFAHNYDEQMAKLSFLSASTKADIKSAVSSGYCVLIPEVEITMDDWTGTGYLIADLKDYNHFVYRISGGLNGGGASEDDPLSDVISMGLTEEFFDSIGADYDDFYGGMFSLGQLLYGILEIRDIISLSKMSWAGVFGCSTATIGAVLVSCQDAYNTINDLATVVGYYGSMLDSILVYAEDSMEGVQLLTTTVLKMICNLTKLQEADVADCVAEMLGVEGYEQSDGLSSVKETLKNFWKEAFKNRLTGKA